MTSTVVVNRRGSPWTPWWLAAVLLAALAAVSIGLWRSWSRVLPDPVQVAAATAPFTLFAGREAEPTRLPTARPAALSGRSLGAPPAVSCPYQRLDIVTSRGEAVGACVSATRMSQSGDLRSFEFVAQGASTWTLRVDTAPDGKVVAVELSAPGEGRFVCEQGACNGVHLGTRDAHGARAIDVAGVSLVSADHARGDVTAGGEPSTVGLSARLSIPPDDQEPQMACAGDRISVVERSGAVRALCPSGGGGMMVLDGHRVFRLRGAAGESIDVGVDAGGTVDLVEIDGLGCHDAECGGARTQPGPRADSEAGRTFAFSGTTVTDGHQGGRSATLNGSAVLPEF